MLKLLLLFTYKVSLHQWKKAGYLSRELNYYQKLSQRNIEIKFLTYGDDKDLTYSKETGKIKIIPCYNYISSKIPIINFIKSFLLPFKLKHIFNDVDLIKTVQVNGSWVGIIAKILYKKRLIIRGGYEWLRNYIAINHLNKKKNVCKYLFHYVKIFLLEYLAYKSADAIILTSDLDIEFIIKKFYLKGKNKKKIYHFYNFINTELFKPLDMEKKDKSVLFIGILYAAKNLFNLLKAFEKLEDFKLDIIGKGSLKPKLIKVAKKLGVNINFLGIVPNEKLPEIINQYQVFILPSYYEGNPKVLLEAMSCGLACIGTNVRGINNLIKHKKNGYLSETGSNSLMQAILALYNDDKLREKIGVKAREFILNNCSIEKIMEKEYNLYKTLFRK